MCCSFVIGGAICLALSIIPTRRIIAELPPGRHRKAWRVGYGLKLLFLAGYLFYLWGIIGNGVIGRDHLVSLIFFAGGTYVLIASLLSVQTINLVRRVVILERENITDPLIGIHNRRYLDRRLDQEVARSLRYEMDLGLILVDLDHFKSINDTLGHRAGDALLSEVGQLLLENLRSMDVVARYGGDEIAVIAPNTDLDGAAVLAQRLCRVIGSARFDIAQSQERFGTPLLCTVSIGVAALSAELPNSSALFEACDSALYFAKKQGRNRVALYHCAKKQIAACG
jgi:diguanylate cyclase (GGDEF)-like protein